MLIKSEDLFRPHLIAKNRRICSLKRTLVVFILLIVLGCGAFAAWFFLFSPTKIKGAIYSMLVLSETTSLSEAQLLQAQIVGAGGGGYIINDGAFKVTAAVYGKASDAQTVKERLQESFPSISVITYKIKPKKIKEKPKKTLKGLLDYPINLVDDILKKSVRLDLLQASDSEILLELDKTKTAIEKRLQNLEKLQKDYPNKEIVKNAADFYSGLLTDFKILVSLSNTDSLGVRLKCFACKTVCNYFVLRGTL